MPPASRRMWWSTLVVICMTLVVSASERPSSFRSVQSGVVNDDLPPHVIEAQRQWEARHAVRGGSSSDVGDWHHHQVEVPQSSRIEELTKEHLAHIRSELSGPSKTERKNRQTEKISPPRTDATFVDMGNAAHKNELLRLSSVQAPVASIVQQSPSSTLSLWLHAASGVEVDPRGNVLKWRDEVFIASYAATGPSCPMLSKIGHFFGRFRLSCRSILLNSFQPSNNTFIAKSCEVSISGTRNIQHGLLIPMVRLCFFCRRSTGALVHNPQALVISCPFIGFPAIQFPCALVNEKLQLQAPLTLFAVLRPILVCQL